MRFAKPKNSHCKKKGSQNILPTDLQQQRWTNDDRLYTFRWTISYILKLYLHLPPFNCLFLLTRWGLSELENLCTGKDEFWGWWIDPQSVEQMFTQLARWGSWAPVLPHGGTDEGALALEDILHCFAAKGRKPPVPWGLQSSWSYFTHCEDL